jgi:Putative transposase.
LLLTNQVHPHLHDIIPGVALSKNHKNWIKIKNKKFLMQVNPPALRFKNLFRQALEKRHPELYLQVPENVWSRDVNWVVHCEAAGYGREVIQYLAPYIFRTAMTDQRNLTLHDDATVSFRYKDNETKQKKTCRLEVPELFRRYLQHVLPKGFVKIRYFGLMGANQGHLQKQLKCLILKSISKKEQAAFLAIVFTPREREMRCRCCGSLLVLAEILKPSRGP